MREILFRGKRTDNGEWIYGSFIPDLLESLEKSDMLDGFIKPFGRTKEERLMVEVERETVGQYTGLTDKNGVKIFEGDIVEYDEEIGKVVYMTDNAAFDVFFDTWNTSFSAINERYIEVIGNIHDNPELLEGGGDNAYPIHL